MEKLSILLLIILSSCSANIHEKKISGKYSLIAHESLEQMSLCYENGFVVENTIFAAGFNDQYIILKQHPYYWARSENMPDSILFPQFKPDKNITYFFIVPIQEPINWNNVYTKVKPLNKEQFANRRKELGIENIQFDIVYKNLE